MWYPDADDGVDRDPGWYEEQDPSLAEQLDVLAEAVLSLRWWCGVFIFHAVGEEEEGEHVDHTIYGKGCRPEDRPERASQGRSRNEESAESRHFKEGDDAAPQRGVVTRLRRDVRKDRGDAGRR